MPQKCFCKKCKKKVTPEPVHKWHRYCGHNIDIYVAGYICPECGQWMGDRDKIIID